MWITFRDNFPNICFFFIVVWSSKFQSEKKESIATWRFDRMIMHIAQRCFASPSRGLLLATSPQRGSGQERRSALYGTTRAHVDQHNLLDYVTHVSVQYSIYQSTHSQCKLSSTVVHLYTKEKHCANMLSTLPLIVKKKILICKQSIDTC